MPKNEDTPGTIFAGKRGLVVEDNVFALDIMTIFLNRLGFTVDGAQNGQEALEQYLPRPSIYDIIFMDLQMPVMSGYEATKKIRDSGVSGSDVLPIIAMSGDPLDNLDELGFSFHLIKPFEMSTLASLMQDFFHT